MAIFKRKRDVEPDAPAEADEAPDASAEASRADGATDASGATAPDEAAATVGISMSSFGGFGSASAPAATVADEQPRPIRALGPEVAPPTTETVPGLRDNVLLREALAGLPDDPSNVEIVGVARQLLQGHLFLRVQGDARALLAEGKDLPLAVATQGDRQFVLVYSSGAALNASVQADGNADTSAMGQPVLTVLRYVLAGTYAGIIVDPASSPARAVFLRELLERTVAEADPQLEVKTLLAGERTPETAGKVGEALTRAKVWVAVNTAADGRQGVAEARSADGERLLELYSHPLEVVAMGRGDQPAPLTTAQLATALRSEGIVGAIVDAAGPWIRLTVDDLAPVLATG